MNQLTAVQQLRLAVKLVKPELLAEVPDDYSPRQVFNYLRHHATNYELLLEQCRQRYGNVTPAEIKALTQGAADVIIKALRTEKPARPPLVQFAQALTQLLGLNPAVDLQAIHQATRTLKASQTMYKSWNERYRRQRELVLQLAQTLDADTQRRIQAIYSANSKVKLDALEQDLHG